MDLELSSWFVQETNKLGLQCFVDFSLITLLSKVDAFVNFFLCAGNGEKKRKA